MNRLFAFAATLALAIVITGTTAQADDDKTPDIKEVMKQHVKGGARMKTEAAVKEKNWEEASTQATKWSKLADALGKNDPPKGTAESWKKMTAAYAKKVKAVADAVEKKDAAGTKKAMGAVQATCGGCHKAHKAS